MGVATTVVAARVKVLNGFPRRSYSNGTVHGLVSEWEVRRRIVS